MAEAVHPPATTDGPGAPGWGPSHSPLGTRRSSPAPGWGEQAPGPDPKSLGHALDSAEVGRYHYRVVLTTGIGFFTDAYDLFVIGAVLVILRQEWHLGSTAASLVGAAALGAAFVGAFVFGRVADTFGRKRIYGLEATIMVVAALGSAFAPSVVWLVAFRALLGIGIGGDYPVSAVLMSEYSNVKDRGRLVGLVFTMQAVGLVVGPLVAIGLIGSGVPHDIAWRVLLGLGAVPAAAVIYLRRKLPESPRFEAARNSYAPLPGGASCHRNGKPGRPEPGVGLAAVAAGHPAPAAWIEPAAVAAGQPAAWKQRSAVMRLLRTRWLLLTVVGTAGTWFLFDYAYYGNTISTPIIVSDLAPRASLTITLALTLAVFVVAAVPGYLLAVAFMDRIGHRRLQIVGFSVMAACFAAIAVFPVLASSVVPFLLVYGVSYFFSEFGPNTTTFVLPAELFPTSLRTTGHGIASGVAKMGAFVGVFLFPILSGDLGLRGTLGVTAGCAALGALLTLVLEEPARRSLEDLERPEGFSAPSAPLEGARPAQAPALTRQPAR